MKHEYIPSDEAVKLKFAGLEIPELIRATRAEKLHGSDEFEKLFERWLAAHDAQIRAEAWDEGHTRGWMDGVENAEPTSPNPYRKENYLYKSNGLYRDGGEQ